MVLGHTARAPALAAALAALALAGCRSSPLAGGDDASFLSGSASADDGWTTPSRPTSIATPAPAWSPPPPPPPADTGGVPWSDGVTTRAGEPTYRAPPPPPPPPPPGGAPTFVVTPSAPCPPVYAPPPVATPVAPAERSWSGCGLPCEDRLSMWHVRGVIGYAFYAGTDPADPCLYWGADLGRTFCGCWGLDLFYRYNSGVFERDNDPRATEDGGAWHHFGIKFTFEGSFNRSRLYWWAGVGPEYFLTDDYLFDDDGFGIFGEAGLGYVVNQNFRIRLGVNVHGMDTDVTRKDPANDGDSRWLWIIAPVLEAEIDF